MPGSDAGASAVWEPGSCRMPPFALCFAPRFVPPLAPPFARGNREQRCWCAIWPAQGTLSGGVVCKQRRRPPRFATEVCRRPPAEGPAPWQLHDRLEASGPSARGHAWRHLCCAADSAARDNHACVTAGRSMTAGSVLAGPRVTERDLLVLGWIAEQYAVRMDVLPVLLGRARRDP